MPTYDIAKGAFYTGAFEPTAFYDYTPTTGLVAGQGAITPTVLVSLAGQAMAVGQGAITPTVLQLILGQAMAAAQGALALGVQVALLGQQLVTYAGKLFVHYQPGAEEPVPVPAEQSLIVISDASGWNAYVPPEQNVLYIPVEAKAGDAEK